jgi:hypothetical protein
MFSFFVVSKDKKEKCRSRKTKKQVRIKYRQSTREYKNIPVGVRFFAPVHTGPGAQQIYSLSREQNGRSVALITHSNLTPSLRTE